MQPVNYDVVAPEYDRRYERNRYDGVRAALGRFLAGARGMSVAEVGCGTGHWLVELADTGVKRLIGLDLSPGMLEWARAQAPNALLVQGTASDLPFADASLDRVFCVNALHHFSNPQVFLAECRRVLRPGGGLLTIGLDPHRDGEEWWVYDFFPSALDADRLRYPSAAIIREWLGTAGFQQAATEVAEHFHASMAFEAAQKHGSLDRRATSQFMVISDDAYEAGMKRLLSERPVLRSNVRLYATTAWV